MAEIVSAGAAVLGYLVGLKSVASPNDTPHARILDEHDLAKIQRLAQPVIPNSADVRAVFSTEALRGLFSDPEAKLVSRKRSSLLQKLSLSSSSASKSSRRDSAGDPLSPKTPKTPMSPLSPAEGPETPMTPTSPIMAPSMAPTPPNPDDKGIVWDNAGMNFPGKKIRARKESRAFLAPEYGVVIVHLTCEKEVDLFVTVVNSILGDGEKLNYKTFMKLIRALHANGIGDIYASTEDYASRSMEKTEHETPLPDGINLYRVRWGSDASESGLTACRVQFVDGFGIPVSVRVQTGEVDQTTELGSAVTMVYDYHGQFLRLSQSGGYLDERGRDLPVQKITI